MDPFKDFRKVSHHTKMKRKRVSLPFILELPSEIVLHIMEFLPFPSLSTCKKVCRRWHILLSSSSRGGGTTLLERHLREMAEDAVEERENNPCRRYLDYNRYISYMRVKRSGEKYSEQKCELCNTMRQKKVCVKPNCESVPCLDESHFAYFQCGNLWCCLRSHFWHSKKQCYRCGGKMTWHGLDKGEGYMCWTRGCHNEIEVYHKNRASHFL